MTSAVLAGAATGAGLFLTLLALVPRRPRIAAVLAELDAGPRPQPRPPQSRFDRRIAMLERALGENIAHAILVRGWLPTPLADDLAILGYDPARYLTSKTAWTITTAVTVPVLLTVPAAAGLLLAAPLTGAWLTVLAAVTAWWLPDARVRRAAKARRRDFTTATAAYLDLVALRTASGAGVAEALTDAATIGEGWPYARLRAALAAGRADGITPARAIGRLGEQLRVSELTDLAAHLSLVDTAGAQAEASLRAKAEALRERQLADAHGRANERSQTMTIAQVLLGLGYLVFIGYPALVKILQL